MMMFDVICTIISYNGLDCLIRKILMWAESEGYDNLTVDLLEELTTMRDMLGNLTYGYGQLQIIWMIFVIRYGDYGTSPRYGWLDGHNKNKIRNFCNEILENINEVWN